MMQTQSPIVHLSGQQLLTDLRPTCKWPTFTEEKLCIAFEVGAPSPSLCWASAQTTLPDTLVGNLSPQWSTIPRQGKLCAHRRLQSPLRAVPRAARATKHKLSKQRQPSTLTMNLWVSNLLSDGFHLLCF